ncbi:pirin family protein, partial [Erwinia amylovora]|nr:pirin family protein [Erwinia amylovora]
YEQRRFDDVQCRQLVLSPDAREGSLKVYQDMTLSRWALRAGEQGSIDVAAGRHIWIQVVKGEVTVNGEQARTSDALAIRDEPSLAVTEDSAAEI